MASFSGIGSPGGIGIDVRTQTVRLLAHAALTKGRVYAVSRTPGSTTEGDAGAVFFDTTAAIAGTNSDGIDDAIGGGVFVLAMEDVAAGAKGLCMISGIMDAELATAGTVAGDILSADTTSALRKPAATQKVIGIALEGGGDGDFARVLFDGLHGFGVKPA